jgi:hypothetical protein
MVVNGEPVLFCFIAWMNDYLGPSRGDTPVWDSRRAEDGIVVPANGKGPYFLGESYNFLPTRDRTGKLFLFGDVQAHVNVVTLGGRDGVANGITVLWCAADPRENNRVKLVGWYRKATIYNRSRLVEETISSVDRRRLSNHHKYWNILTRPGNGILLDADSRPPLPVTPGLSKIGRWHAQTKAWRGGDSAPLRMFVKRCLDHPPKLAKPPHDALSPIVWRKMIASARERRGQKEFRDRLLLAYEGRCAITGTRTGALLDACHIYPASLKDSYHATRNGILLRTDLHTLFDLGLLSIEPITRKVWVSTSVREAEYREIHGKPLRPPALGYPAPYQAHLDWHWKNQRKS